MGKFSVGESRSLYQEERDHSSSLSFSFNGCDYVKLAALHGNTIIGHWDLGTYPTL